MKCDCGTDMGFEVRAGLQKGTIYKYKVYKCFQCGEVVVDVALLRETIQVIDQPLDLLSQNLDLKL